jgi:3-hydroxyisobutyrate dehydrogenase-like beta-hydroxyacid dehydrogenase
VNGAGARCIDAGVMGPPPTDTVTSRLFVSGPDAAALSALGTSQLSVYVVSAQVGDASAIKLCDSVMSKGMTALLVQMLIVAKRLGVDRTLAEQCVGPRRYFHDWIMRTLPIVPPKAYRWVPEVQEVAKMFESAGVPGAMMRDAADIYAWLADTPLGRETPEERDAARTGEDIVRALASS